MLLALLLACADAPGPSPTRRVDGVAAPKIEQRQLDGFCDESGGPTDGRPFPIPPTTPELGASTRWRWVNVWATWCGPCVAEMPMLDKWAKKLVTDGVDIELVNLNVDSTADAVTRFEAKHPGFPTGPRLRSPEDLTPWTTILGNGSEMALPVHIFVDPEGRMRCVRAGAIDGGDYALVKAIVGG